ncbi:kinase-like domain-containing protein [Mycena rosella]|uniref:Kinase-like domain-containing protein n=1 Tax=Mycena rosella TaxID=1033263 RepID=A0AAD7G2C3_MYCRO|nr:kinase-like domain-containing protein [Mycena rosella]
MADSATCPPTPLDTPEIPSYRAPFGTYPGDTLLADLGPSGALPLSISENGAVYRHSERGVVAKTYDGSGMRITATETVELPPGDGERAWNMMRRAGDSCITIVGRVFRRPSTPVGYYMPIEVPLDASKIATKEERVRIIRQLRELVAEIHGLNMVHGDVKPQNLLLCSDGRLRFCDFDNASIEGDGFTSTSMTYPYCSPARMRDRTGTVPWTRAEDIYAMGLTIWEIYTGRTPLTYGNETLDSQETRELLENRCHVGFLPDMQLIDDPEVTDLIEECLAAAPECPDVLWDDAVYCVEQRYTFHHCKLPEAHRWSRIVHSGRCGDRADRGDDPCEEPFLAPKIITTRREPTCPTCMKRVVYIGVTG